MTRGLEHVRSLRHDGTGRGRRMDPRCHRVFVVVIAVAAEPDDVLALDEALAVEACRLADATLRKLRLAVLRRQRPGWRRWCRCRCRCRWSRAARGSRLRHCHWHVEIAVQRVVRHQPARRSPRHRRTLRYRRFPCCLCRGQRPFHLRKRCLRRCQRAIQLLESGSLFARWRLDEGRRVSLATSLAVLGNVVEVRVELVELLLRERIVFVVVTARTTCREPEEHRRRRSHTRPQILPE